MTSKNKLRKIDAHGFNSLWHLLFLILSPFMAILFIILYKKNESKRSNISYMRHKKATQTARKKLKKAEQFLINKDKSGFYAEVNQALWGYISDKFNIPLSNLSIENIKVTYETLNIDNMIFTESKSLIDHCEFARYAPAEGQDDMQQIYNRALVLISQIEKSVK